MRRRVIGSASLIASLLLAGIVVRLIHVGAAPTGLVAFYAFAAGFELAAGILMSVEGL